MDTTNTKRWIAIGIRRNEMCVSTLQLEYNRPMVLAEVIADIERRHPDLRSISATPQRCPDAARG